MRRWCLLSDEILITPGDFLEASLTTVSGAPIESQDELLCEWAGRLMLRYESQPIAPTLVLNADLLECPHRTKHFYRRLFDSDGSPTQHFLTWASETLAHWMEHTFEGVYLAEGSIADQEPGYDIICLYLDDSDSPRLHLTQVKATQHELQRNCNDALEKFRRLDNGDFDRELLSRLRLLHDLGRMPTGSQPAEVLYAPGRSYRVTALHSQDRTAIHIMTTYSERIPGQPKRRTARMIYIADWPQLWNKLARILYAQLT
jgi:hypothetical protein